MYLLEDYILGDLYHRGRWLLACIMLAGLSCTEQSITDNEIIIPEPRTLVRDGWKNTQPAWHPLGDRFVFVAAAAGSDIPVQIKIYHFRDEKTENLFDESRGVFHPDLSPDGGKLVFSSGEIGKRRLYILDMVDGQLEKVSPDSGDQIFPRWSPSGRIIAYLHSGSLVFLSVAEKSVAYASGIDYKIRAFCWVRDGGEIILAAENRGKISLYRYILEEKKIDQISGRLLEGNWVSSSDLYDGQKKYLDAYLAYEYNGAIYTYSYSSQTINLIAKRGAMPACSPDGTKLLYSRDGSIILDSIWIAAHE